MQMVGFKEKKKREACQRKERQAQKKGKGFLVFATHTQRGSKSKKRWKVRNNHSIIICKMHIFTYTDG